VPFQYSSLALFIEVCPCGLSLEDALEELKKGVAKADWWRGLRAVKEGRVVVVDGNQVQKASDGMG
jgi:hypothetical protein